MPERKFSNEVAATKTFAIKDVHMVKFNNHFYSNVVEEYMYKQEKFLPFVKENKRQEFMQAYRSTFELVGHISDETVYTLLVGWEAVCGILKLLHDNPDWNEIHQTLFYQGHNVMSFNTLLQRVVYFSDYGLDLVEALFGKEERFSAEKNTNFEKYSSCSSFSIPKDKLVGLI